MSPPLACRFFRPRNSWVVVYLGESAGLLSPLIGRPWSLRPLILGRGREAQFGGSFDASTTFPHLRFLTNYNTPQSLLVFEIRTATHDDPRGLCAVEVRSTASASASGCLLYTSDAADE